MARWERLDSRLQGKRTNCRQDKQISRREGDKKTVVGVGATWLTRDGWVDAVLSSCLMPNVNEPPNSVLTPNLATKVSQKCVHSQSQSFVCFAFFTPMQHYLTSLVTFL